LARARSQSRGPPAASRLGMKGLGGACAPCACAACACACACAVAPELHVLHVHALGPAPALLEAAAMALASAMEKVRTRGSFGLSTSRESPSAASTAAVSSPSLLPGASSSPTSVPHRLSDTMGPTARRRWDTPERPRLACASSIIPPQPADPPGPAMPCRGWCACPCASTTPPG
jgi:hypothetical protein